MPLTYFDGSISGGIDEVRCDVGIRVVFMDAGEIVEVNAPDAFFDARRHPRTQAFLSQILY